MKMQVSSLLPRPLSPPSSAVLIEFPGVLREPSLHVEGQEAVLWLCCLCLSSKECQFALSSVHPVTSAMALSQHVMGAGTQHL